jgi:hypothetical protein
MRESRGLPSGKAPIIKTFNEGQHSILLTSIDKVDGTLAVQKAMFGVKPQSDFFRRINVGKPILNVSKFRKNHRRVPRIAVEILMLCGYREMNI